MQRKVVLVLGMHRSGTSALARTLSFLGCDLPRNLVPETPTNPTGHWEPNVLMTFNNEILESAGSRWDDWLEFNPLWYSSPVADHFVERASGILSTEYGTSPLFVLKDPRNCRLARFWFDVFDREVIEPLVILPLRSPLEVMASLETRDGMHRDHAMLLWLRHVLDAEQGSRGRRRLFATYEELLLNWRLLAERMQAVFDIFWPKSIAHAAQDVGNFLHADYRHHIHPMHMSMSDPAIAQWVLDANSILLKWANEGEDRQDYAALDQIRQQLNAAAPTLARLIRDVGDARRTTEDLRSQVAVSQSELVALRESNAQISEEHATEMTRYVALTQQLQEQNTALADQLAEEKSDLARQLRNMEQALEKAKSDLAHRQHDLAGAQSTLRQRDEEIHQTLATLADAQKEAAAARAIADEKLKTAHAKLKAADEWVFRLAGDRKVAEEQTASALRRVAVTEKASADLAARIAELERMHTLDRQALDRQQEEMNSTATTHALLLAQEQAQVQRWQLAQADTAKQVEALTQSLGERNVEAESLHFQLAGLKVQADRQSRDVEKLSGRLTEKEAEAERMTQHARWLQEVNVVVTGYPRWWVLLPRTIQDKWRHRRLRRRGLFDAEAYLNRYPDVLSSGMNPLRHYILHGMAENRTL
ncbi:MAG: hypothetical protein U5M50_05685 [Sphingobium sp.]|nr:hypothetical protein [Sphingobium sp.]